MNSKIRSMSKATWSGVRAEASLITAADADDAGQREQGVQLLAVLAAGQAVGSVEQGGELGGDVGRDAQQPPALALRCAASASARSWRLAPRRDW